MDHTRVQLAWFDGDGSLVATTTVRATARPVAVSPPPGDPEDPERAWVSAICGVATVVAGGRTVAVDGTVRQVGVWRLRATLDPTPTPSHAGRHLAAIAELVGPPAGVAALCGVLAFVLAGASPPGPALVALEPEERVVEYLVQVAPPPPAEPVKAEVAKEARKPRQVEGRPPQRGTDDPASGPQTHQASLDGGGGLGLAQVGLGKGSDRDLAAGLGPRDAGGLGGGGGLGDPGGSDLREGELASGPGAHDAGSLGGGGGGGGGLGTVHEARVGRTVGGLPPAEHKSRAEVCDRSRTGRLPASVAVWIGDQALSVPKARIDEACETRQARPPVVSTWSQLAASLTRA